MRSTAAAYRLNPLDELEALCLEADREHDAREAERLESARRVLSDPRAGRRSRVEAALRACRRDGVLSASVSRLDGAVVVSPVDGKHLEVNAAALLDAAEELRRAGLVVVVGSNQELRITAARV
jgi:hypothetical protein